jgi:ABC-2 type transport system permease protein
MSQESRRVHATLLVAGREIREAMRRRSFWIVVGILVLGSTAAMVLPEVLDSGPTTHRVAVSGSPAATRAFEQTLSPVVRSLGEKVRYRSESPEVARRLVDDGKVSLAVDLSGTPRVVVQADHDDTLLAATRQAIASDTLATRLHDAGLSDREVSRLLDVRPAHVEELDVEGSDRQGAAAALSIVLYLFILMMMGQTANGVAIEKANRISEVLLAIVKPSALLFGKILGILVVGLASLAAGALPIAVKAVAGGSLPAGLGPAVLGGAPWYVLGIALYLTLGGALGALVERQEEAGAVVAPLSIVLIATYILAETNVANTDFARSLLGETIAVFPLTSPIVMPMRIALGEATVGEVAVSLGLLVIALVVAIRLGGAIYRRGIVFTGRRLRVREALRAP